MSAKCSLLGFLLLFIRPARVAPVVCAVISCLPLSAYSIDIDYIDVTEKAGVYRINVSAELAVPVDYVRAVLLDYSHQYRLSQTIVESEVLASYDDGGVMIRSKILCCNVLFCRDIERVDTVGVLKSGDIEARIVPELSEFSSGRAVWKLEGNDYKTRLTYEAHVEPDFFIPPLLGTMMVKQQMHEEFKETYIRVERIARINHQRDWDADMEISRLAMAAESIPCDETANVLLR